MTNIPSTKILVPWPELEFTAVRSSGAGGQNVNKTNSAVILRWNVLNSQFYPSETLQKIIYSLQSRLTTDGDLLIRSETSRDQSSNKSECVEKLIQLIRKALTPVKKRKATRPSRSAQRKRIVAKKLHGEKKKLRGRVGE